MPQEKKHRTLPEMVEYWTRFGNGHFNMYQYMKVVEAKKDLLKYGKSEEKKDTRKS